MSTWFAVIAVGAFSYCCRLLPLLFAEKLSLDPRVSDALRHAGMGALAAILVAGAAPMLAGPGQWAPVVASIVTAGWLAWSGRPMLVVVLSGVGLFVALDLLL